MEAQAPAVSAPLAQLPNALTIARLVADPGLRRAHGARRTRAELAGRHRLRHRRDHRPGGRLPRAPLARRVALRQDRRPARRPADDRRRRDPARRTTTGCPGRGSPSSSARDVLLLAGSRRARPAGDRDRGQRRRQGRDVDALRRDLLPHRHAPLDAVAARTSSGPASCSPSSPPCSTSGPRGENCGDEGRRHGRGRGHAAAAAHLEPAEADGADRRQAVHGAHRRAPQAPRLRGRDRHRRLPAAGDPQLLRQRRDARRRHRLLGGGVAARHRRLGASARRAGSTTRSSSSPATRSATST